MFKKARFQKILEPYRIKHVNMRNRMVKLSAAMGLATEDGFVTDANLGFYEALAKGGVGLIIVEHGFVDYPMGVTGPRRIAINDDKYLPGLTKLAGVIHKYETPCFQQLGHSGPSQRWLLEPGQRAVTASSSKSTGPRELSASEIEELIGKYGKAAERAREVGFDGVEIHAAVAYLLNSFLSRADNARNDIYGSQDMQNRGRILIGILQEVRRLVGETYPVGVRLNGAEYGLGKGTSLEESQVFAKMCQDAGADYICLQARGAGAYGFVTFPEQMKYPEPAVPLAKLVPKPGALTPLAAAIKKAVSIPVIAVGRLDAELGEKILTEHKADLIGMNRRLLADPEYPNKIALGRLDEIAPCTACMECWASQQEGKPIRCRINPVLGRERELTSKPTGRKKKVLVVGGGPAGMEAARLSAMRGHEVILCEKGNSLGGLLPLAALIKGTEVEDIPAMESYLEKQIKKLNVKVRCRTEVNTKLVERIKPDAVIIASGGTLSAPEIQGINNRIVVSNVALHRLFRRVPGFISPGVLRWLTKYYLPFGKRIVIIGGQMQGCELAEFLVKRGRNATVLEESGERGTGIHEMNRPRLLRWLTNKGATMLAGIKYEKITDEGIVVLTKEGERKEIKADRILIATPPVPNNTLFEALKGKMKELYQVGDSGKPQGIVDAIADGAQVGREV